jgi:hypothetical protein
VREDSSALSSRTYTHALAHKSHRHRRCEANSHSRMPTVRWMEQRRRTRHCSGSLLYWPGIQPEMHRRPVADADSTKPTLRLKASVPQHTTPFPLRHAVQRWARCSLDCADADEVSMSGVSKSRPFVDGLEAVHSVPAARERSAADRLCAPGRAVAPRKPRAVGADQLSRMTIAVRSCSHPEGSQLSREEYMVQKRAPHSTCELHSLSR